MTGPSQDPGGSPRVSPSAPSSEYDDLPRPGKRVEFLDKASYRQRRMRDGARVLPVFAAIMMALPLMWPRGAEGQSLTSSGILYLFGLWAVLVVLAFGVNRAVGGAPHLDEAADSAEQSKG